MTYTDAYLAPLATPGREAKATADIDSIASFPTSPVNWRERLITLRVYILICLESMKAPDDVFTAKLKAYRAEYETALSQAMAATVDAATGLTGVSFSVSLERG